MSIRFRLNALMVTLLALALVSFLAAMVMSAGPRIQAENDSMMRLSKEFVETAIESLQGTANPRERLNDLLDALKNLRHVRIYRASDAPVPAHAPADQDNSQTSDLLTRMAQPEARLEIPVFVNGQSFGEIVVAPQASDESAEIWDSITKFSEIGTTLAIATVLLMSLLIGRLLRPIKTVGEALILLDAGKYDVAVPEGGPPEIADICGKLNRLAATLKATLSENHRLAQRIISVQDEERKDLARELHDELGPYLFAIRAGASAIRTEAERGTSDKGKIVKSCSTMQQHIETMQRMNRRVLQKLRPIGLEEFGLKAKLGSLVAMWRESRPDVGITLDVSDAIPERDETSNLTIYRVVQEGVTNAFRHANATAIEIVVEPASERSETEAQKRSEHPSVRITVSDNGKGLDEEMQPSYGIAGMTERVWATGGKLRIYNRPSGGVTLEACIPVTANQAPETAAAG